MFGLDQADFAPYPDLARAVSLASTGKLSQALELAKRFSAANPALSGGHVVESAIAERAGDHAAVLSSCRRAVEIEPGRVDVYFRGVMAALHLGDELAADGLFAGVTPRVLETGKGVDQLWTLFQYAGQAFCPAPAIRSEVAALPASPLISVIVPTAGRENLLAHAVRSLLQQSYRNWEAIIINARSEPLTFSTKDPRVKIVEPGSVLTAAQARNHGLELMQGELFCFLDDDDLFKPQHLAAAVAALRGANVVGVFSDADMVYESISNGMRKLVKCVPTQPGREYSPYLMEMRNYVLFNEPVFRRDSCGSLRFDEALDRWEDWDYMLAAFAAGPFGRVHASTAEVRRRQLEQSDHMSHKDEGLAASCNYLFNKRAGTRAWINLGRQVFKRIQGIAD